MDRIKNIQTLEQFTEAVKRGFKSYYHDLSDKEINDYFNTDDIKSMIKERFDDDYEDLKNGKITQSVFDIGCVSSVVYCLYYMY